MPLAIELHARDALRLPGMISLARLPLAIAFPFAVRRARVAIALLAAAGATDMLDGWLARRRHEETATGAILDAAADKAFVVSVVAGLVLRGRLLPADVLLLSTRELIEGPLLVWEMTHAPERAGTERRAIPLGKLTTTLQFIAFVCVLLRIPHRIPLIGAGATGLAAGIAYGLRERAERRRAARSIDPLSMGRTAIVARHAL